MNFPPGLSTNTSVLLTGGAGFVGSHLAERLVRAGVQLTILDDLNNAYSPDIKRDNLRRVAEHGAFEFVQADIGNWAKLQAALSGRSYEVIIHLAARTGVRSSLTQPVLYERVNVQGTLALLELARKGECRKFIFASSSSVYGKTGRTPFSEDEVSLNPLSPYGVTKLAGEKLCYCFAHLYPVKVICLRFFTVYGPRQRPDLAIHKFARSIDRNQPITVFGDGSSRRDYTYVDDIVDGILAALSLETCFEIFNLGNGNPISLKQMIQFLEKCLGKRAQLLAQEDQPGEMPFTHADISKAGRLLNYAPQVDFEEGLSRFVAWFQATTRRYS